MALALRILLWTIVLLVPGGVLAVPLLIAHHTRKGSAPPASATDLVPEGQGSAALVERMSQA